MDKTLQTTAWRCLPREFKEEVKFEYHRVATKASKEEYDLGFMHAHEGIFGIHNLTSDADGEEELLTVQRSKVIDIFTQNTILLSEGHSEYLSGYYNGKCHVLKDLFGSKCLPDELNDDKIREVRISKLDKSRIIQIGNNNINIQGDYYADINLK